MKMTIKVLISTVFLLSIQMAQGNDFVEAYKNAGSVCKSSEIESLLIDYKRWINKPDVVPDMRLRFEAFMTEGCDDGLLMLLYSKTQLNAGKNWRYYNRCNATLPILNSSIESLKKNYPQYLIDVYKSLGVCSAVAKRPISKTIEWYKFALAENPQSIDLKLTLANFYGRDRQTEKSNKLVLKMLEKGLPEGIQRRAYSILGSNEALENNPKKAITYFKKVAVLNHKLMNRSDPFTLANLAKNYDKFDKKQGQLYWEKLKKLKDNPNRNFQLDDETESLLISKTNVSNKVDNQFTSKTFLNWDLSYSTLFKSVGINVYDNARQEFSKKKIMELHDIDQQNIKSAVMIDSLEIHHFGYRVSILFFQTNDDKTFRRSYEEKNSRQKEVKIDTNNYNQILNKLRSMKQPQSSKKYDTFAGYGSVISIFEEGKPVKF